MKKLRIFLGLVLAASLWAAQAGRALAAPVLGDSGPVGGVVQSITLETDSATGMILVLVDVMDADQNSQTVWVSLESAIALGLVVLSADGTPGINSVALGNPIQLDPAGIMPVQPQNQHPVGSALATFFSDIEGIDYESIMAAHDQGIGFGVLAQMLWLTTKLEGDAQVFEALVTARETGDYSAFVLEDGSTPENWGQLRKAILDGDKKKGLGVVISDQNSNPNGNGNGNGHDKDNNGNGNGGENNGNNGANGSNGNKDKDRDKEKDKDK